MKLLVSTSNALRHKFVANTVTQHADEALVIAECQPQAASPESHAGFFPALAAHFRLREEAEQAWFAGHDAFRAGTLPVVYGEVNSATVQRVISAWHPELAIVFGASLIREPLLSLLPQGRTVNLHLGLSPYYRGSGTNFWPFVNGELEYVGATLLHLDRGIDSGPIIAHVRPEIARGDTVHTAGCRVIQAGAVALVQAMEIIRRGGMLPRIPQWPVAEARYYRQNDVTEEVLARYHHNLQQGLVERYLARDERPVQLISLPSEAIA